MLQILQHQKTGKITVEELPSPALRKGGVLLRNVASLISVGTERASLETAKSSLLGKMNRRPDLTRQVFENLKREGALNTYRKVRSRLDTYKEPGYSCSGIVIESSAEELVPGDRVACGGAEFAHHAGIVFVPKNLVVKIPETVSFEDGAFVTLGSVALQGVRQSGLQLAESVAVVGLGLVGLLTVQLLRGAGCKVFGYDVAETNLALAEQFGCTHCSTNREDSLASIHSHTGGHGADAVIITAATTSGEPMEAAVDFVREKGRIVVVGDVGMNLQRKGFYEKELELRLSRSYGPGRYDKQYEEKGEDYPRAFVRWTAKRNMEAVVDCLSAGMLNVQPLISDRFPIRKAADAYDLIVDPKRTCLGIIIQHEHEKVPQAPPVVSPGIRPVRGPVLGVIGAGNFAQSYLLPHLKGVRLKRLATLRPSSAMSAARKFPFEAFGTNADEIFQDPEINAVVIATRHDSHATLAARALESGKHLFIEKPLAISREELDSLADARSTISNPPVLMVGFNRRFSTPVLEVKKFFQGSRQPLSINYRINAGHLPPEHWIFDDEQGGRIVGEVCHFVDLISFLADAQPVRVFAESSGNSKFDKSVTVSLRLSDGSAGVIHYVTDGDTSMPKEYCEISSAGRTAVIDNFTEVVFHKGGKMKRKKFDGSKGHRQEVMHFINVLTGREKPGVTFEDLYRSSLAALLVQESLRTGAPQDVTT